MTADEARAYLSSLSAHRDRPGDVSNMNPEFAVRLATAIQQARAENIPVSLMSGYRDDNTTGSAYDAGGNSSHGYGLAGDVAGLDGPNGKLTTRWGQIASANGLSNPYGIDDSAEFNHWQLPARPLEQTPDLLANLQRARASGDMQAMWNAYTPSGGGPAVASGPNFYDTVEQHESGGKNIQNSAGADAWGYYQFTTPTWSTVRAARPDLNLPESVLAASHDQQLSAYRHLVSQNVAALEKAGVPINDKNAFMASFLGAGGATQFLNAMKNDPNGAAAAAFSKEAAANPTVFYEGDHPRSYAGIYALMTGKFGEGNTTGFGPNAVASAGGAGAASQTPAAPKSPDPMAALGASLGQALASMGSPSSGGSATRFADPPDQPAIRAPALFADFTSPAANPVPANLTGLGPQLGSLAIQTQQTPFADPDSITQGAPSMTAMLGQLGSPNPANPSDPRATNTPNPYARYARLG